DHTDWDRHRCNWRPVPLLSPDPRWAAVLVMFLINELSVGYSGVPIVQGASFSASPGHLTALIGANGAGKSTMLKAIAGLLPSSGTVQIDGGAIDPRQDVAYMPQDTSAASGLTMLEAVMLGRLRSLGWQTPPDVIQAAADLLDRFGLADLAERPLIDVSGGQRQLAFLAQALMRRPKVLLLDEPTAALDLRHQMLVLETVAKDASDSGVIVILAMHDLSLVGRFTDHVVCLKDGQVLSFGTPTDTMTERRLQEMYGVRVEIELLGGRPRVELLGTAEV
ncbi:MAG: ABC transporter ATP-binding protein, partial [Pseudomonadota bacterium]